MTHDLKTWPIFFQAIWDGRKAFEVRKDDRGFAIGDLLILKEFEPEGETYSGKSIHVEVEYILKGEKFGIMDGYCVMSIVIIEKHP